MAGIEAFIISSDRLTDIFGYWPSFHDAEVVDIHLWRGDVDPEKERFVFPVMTVRLYVWEWAKGRKPGDAWTPVRQTLTTLRFHGVRDDIRLNGFDHLNQIVRLSIVNRRPDEPVPLFEVRFERGLGMEASFTCTQIQVIEAWPCGESGGDDRD